MPKASNPSKMKVKYVDGYKIRQFWDIDFSIVHFRNPDPIFYSSKWYIPDGEIWFDLHYKPEEDFVLKIEMAPFKKIKGGGSADLEHKAYAERFAKKETPPNFLIKERRIEWGVRLKHVDGAIVRQYIDPLFAYGGHDFVYSYIPKGEIWVDTRMDSREMPHVILHEITERRLMAKEGKTYDSAHDYANVVEKEARRQAGGSYPGDANYPAEWSFKKLLKEFHVSESKQPK